MVGEGVAKSRMGERVWTWNAQWKRAFGTCADYVVLPAALAAPLPAGVSFEAGACLGIPAMTAYHAVAVAGASKGVTVLVSGGAGGVGHYAIQFAKARGATVITTVSSEAKAKLAQAAGADHVIDYKRENVAERVSAVTAKKGVDAVVEMDLAANAKLYPGILRARSSVVVYGTGSAEAQIPAQFLLVNAIAIRFIFVYELTDAERAAAIGDINRMLADKTLINNVALTLPLTDIVTAHEAVEQGKTMGNVVVRIGGACDGRGSCPRHWACHDSRICCPPRQHLHGEGDDRIAHRADRLHADQHRQVDAMGVRDLAAVLLARPRRAAG